MSDDQDQGQIGDDPHSSKNVVLSKRGRPIKKFNSVDDQEWECDTCKSLFTDKKSKLLECEYCEIKRYIKYLKIPESTNTNVGDRPDFLWFCHQCIVKAKKCIREELEIKVRCNDFIQNFRQEINTKLEKMQSEIDDGLKTKVNDKP